MRKVGATTAGVESLQPHLSLDELLDPVSEVADNRIKSDLADVIRIWAHKEKDTLPDFFEHEFTITSIKKQPTSSIVLLSQLIHRELKSELVPTDNEDINTQPLESDDLFALAAVNQPCEFPHDTREESHPIPGNEKLKLCSACDGATKVTCGTCEGAGKVFCHHCEGVGSQSCRTCDGAGSIIVEGSSLAECNDCGGDGGRVCGRCSGSGRASCTKCRSGLVDCENCDSCGMFVRKWSIQSSITTDCHLSVFSKSSWHEFDDPVGLDGTTMHTIDFDLTSEPPDENQIRHELPPHLFPMARDLIEETHFHRTLFRRKTGIRIIANACFSYLVSVDQNGKTGELLISGVSNRVTPLSLPSRSSSFGNKVMRAISSGFAKVGLSGESKTTRRYRQNLNSRSVHLLDKQSLGPRLSDLGAKVELTSHGYNVTHPMAYRSVAISFESGSGKTPTLEASVSLGLASPEFFPTALIMNQTLEIGFVGIVEDTAKGFYQFVLVYRRPYEFIEPESYWAAIKSLLETSQQIKESGKLN